MAASPRDGRFTSAGLPRGSSVTYPISARENIYAYSVAPLTPDEIGWSPPPLSIPNSNRMRLIARALAQAFLSGPWELDQLVERGGQALDRRRRWLRPL